MISIIVPVYNSERWLSECVESIIAQSVGDWELILVDDGSTDSSGQICDDYAAHDSRIRVLHVENGGQSYARNCGIEACKGDRIIFVDSDDTIAPCFIERLSSVDADIVCCGFSRDDKKRFSMRNSRAESFSPREALLNGLYQHRISNSAWGKIYKRKIFDKIRFTEGLYYEDLEIFPRTMLAADGRIIVLNDKLYFYRNTPHSIINTWNEHRLDVLKVTEEFDRMFGDDAELHKAAVSRRFSANYNIMLLSLKLGQYDIAAKCYEYIRSVRAQILTDSKVRFKNKIGAIVSYGGIGFIKLLSRI